MIDVIKAVIILSAYFLAGPLLGMMAAHSRPAQRMMAAAMLFMTALPPGNITLMLISIEKYRGHTKGFVACWIEVLAIALIVAAANRQGHSRLWPPGLGVYWTWCVLSLLSLPGSYEPLYALMAFVKFFKAGLIFWSIAVFLKDETDLRWLCGSMSAALLTMAVVGLKMRYLEGRFQIRGWFEHQNPMAMWAYMMALPLLSAALWKDTKMKDMLFWLAGVGAAGLCIILSVSRASLAIYGAGCGMVVLLAWLRGPTLRLCVVSMAGIGGAVLVGLFAMDSINARLEQVKTSAETAEFDLREVLDAQSEAMLRDHPWTGIGWNNFGIANSRPRGDRYSQVLEDWDASRGFTIYEENYLANPLTESLYWLWLAETGWLGFLSFLLFEVVTVWLALVNWWKGRNTFAGVIASALLLMLVFCYLHGTVERILTQTKNLSQWLLLCGMLAGLEMRRRSLKAAVPPA